MSHLIHSLVNRVAINFLKVSLTLLLINALSMDVFSQIPELQWQRSIGGSNNDFANAVRQTNDGGFILTGRTFSSDGDITSFQGVCDLIVAKLDSSGNPEWIKTYGGSDWDEGFDICQTADSGFIVVGMTRSQDGHVDGNNSVAGSFDAWFLKLTPTGDLQWQKCLGGSFGEEARGVVQAYDGGYVLAGTAGSDNGDVSGNNGEVDIWVVKLDFVGNIVWQVCLGGSDVDYGFALDQTLDSGFVVVGAGMFAPQSYGSRIFKIDSEGNVEWERAFSDPNSLNLYQAYAVQQTSDEGYIVGSTYYFSGEGEIHLVKLAPNGATQWEKFIGGSDFEEVWRILETEDGGYVIAGYTCSVDSPVTNLQGVCDFWLVKTDSSGEIIWQKTCGGSLGDFAYGLDLTSDGGYILIGDSKSSDGDITSPKGLKDIWVVKLTSPNSTIWYLDADGDGYGDPATAMSAESSPGPNYVLNGDDCDDDPNACGSACYPGADEICDEYDNNCDGLINNLPDNSGTLGGFSVSSITPCGEQWWYQDQDNDEYYGVSLLSSSQPEGPGWSLNPQNGGNDCDDLNPEIHPNGTEICGNGVDENCNGMADDTITDDCEPSFAAAVVSYDDNYGVGCIGGATIKALYTISNCYSHWELIDPTHLLIGDTAYYTAKKGDSIQYITYAGAGNPDTSSIFGRGLLARARDLDVVTNVVNCGLGSYFIAFNNQANCKGSIELISKTDVSSVGADDGSATFKLSKPAGMIDLACGEYAVSPWYVYMKNVETDSIFAMTEDGIEASITRTNLPPGTYSISFDYAVVCTKMNVMTLTIGDAINTEFDADSICPFAVVGVAYSSTQLFENDNRFFVELSDATGNFSGSSPLVSDSVPSTQSSGIIETYFMQGLPPGSGYRVRVVSTNPEIFGKPSAPFALRNSSDNDNDGWTVCGGDCDDNDSAINPGPNAVEVCDGKDNDCNGTVDDFMIVEHPGPILCLTCVDEYICRNSIHSFHVNQQASNVSFSWVLPPNAMPLGPVAGNSITVKFMPSFSGGVLSVAAISDCGQSEASIFNLITPGPGGDITGPLTVCKHSTAVYSVGLGVGITSFKWKATGGAKIISADDQTVVLIEFKNASSTINLTTQTVCGNPAVQNNLHVSVVNCRMDESEDQRIDRLDIYPVPASKEIYVQTYGEGTANVRVLDLQGRVVYDSDEQVYGLVKIDISDLPAAAYFVSLIFSDRVEIGRFIKD